MSDTSSTQRFVAGVLSVLLLLGALFAVTPPVAAQDAGDSPWYHRDDDGAVSVDLYFVWSETCPHCLKAKPFIEGIPDRLPWVSLHSLPTSSEEAIETAVALADGAGEEISAVPAFMTCGRVYMGYDDDDGMGAYIVERLEACRAVAETALAPPVTAPVAAPGAATTTTTTTVPEDEQLNVPVLGDVDAESVSLPLFTIAIAGLDAFNPCAFFVLLFLLSLLVHARSRARMAAIGGIFVVISGLVYFVFMAAWLNVFDLIGEFGTITLIAGLVAIAIALFNVKDYFLADKGPSLAIPEAAKPGLFRKMRTLTTSASVPALALGAVTLAIAANSYEILCTAGFPMVYTRVLTLNDLPTASYYGYLVLYNIVYVIPLLLIVAVFVWSLGSRKLKDEEGRALKLLSGIMMLGLGVVLVVAPEELSNLYTAVTLLGVAVGATGIVIAGRRLHDRTHHRIA